MVASPTNRDTCVPVDTVLSLLEGELPPSDRERVHVHIDGCDACQAVLSEAARGVGPRSSPGAGVLDPGTELARRYRIEEFVARGGMGEIYRVRDLVLDESIALKTLTAAALDTPKAIQRMKAEVKLSRRVGNPHTCRIFDFGEHELPGRTLHFLTMEFVEGQSLGHHLREAGRFQPQAALPVARQLIDGLLAAHAVGVLHRDLKSDNVMLRAAGSTALAGHAVIMDFGLARALHDDGDRLTSHTQALMGSAAYMAPEQVEGASLTEAADVYALGVVLFEMLTGTLPFRAATPVATAVQRLRRAPPRPSSLVPGIERPWDDVILGCLERKVDKRLTLQEIRADLAPPGPGAPLASRRRARANRRSIALAFALGCGVGAVVLGVWGEVGSETSLLAIRPGSEGAPKPAGLAVDARAEPGAPPRSGDAASAKPAAASSHETASPSGTERQEPVADARGGGTSPGGVTARDLLLRLARARASLWRAEGRVADCRAAAAAYRDHLVGSRGEAEADPLARQELSRLGDCTPPAKPVRRVRGPRSKRQKPAPLGPVLSDRPNEPRLDDFVPLRPRAQNEP